MMVFRKVIQSFYGNLEAFVVTQKSEYSDELYVTWQGIELGKFAAGRMRNHVVGFI